MPSAIPFLPRILSILSMGLLMLSLSGCISRYNPLQPRWYQSKSDGDLLLNRCQNPPDYASGRKCLLELQQLYLEAGANDLQRSDLLALLVIPTAAAATGVGIAGGPANAITGLSLGAATLFGYGAWYSNPMRAEIFGLGAKALSCVVSASEPLEKAALRSENIASQRRDVQRNLENLKQALTAFKLSPKGTDSGPAPTMDDSLIRTSEIRQDEAKTLLRTADELLDAINSSGTMLWNTAMAINAEVVTAQFKTARDFRDLQEHLQSSVFGLQKDILGVVPPRSEPTKGQFQGATEGPPRAAELISAALKELERSMDILESSLGTVQIDDLNQTFAQCLVPVKTVQVSGFLRVRFVTKSTVTPPYTVRFVISGGQPPYTAALVDGPNDKIVVTGPGSSQPAVVDVEIKEGLPPKEYNVLVVDSAGTAKAVKILVVQEGGKTEPAQPSKDEEMSLAQQMKTQMNNWTTLMNFAGAASSGWTVASKKRDDPNIEYELVFDSNENAAKALEKIPKPEGVKTVQDSGNKNKLIVMIQRDKIKKLIHSGWPGTGSANAGGIPATPTTPVTPTAPVQ